MPTTQLPELPPPIDMGADGRGPTRARKGPSGRVSLLPMEIQLQMMHGKTALIR